MYQQSRPEFTYLGHATVHCRLPNGKTILIDPWIMNNPFCPDDAKDLDSVDSILITHGHADHMSDAVEVAETYSPDKVVACHEICLWLTGEGVENCSGMNLGGCQEVCGADVNMVRADHSAGIEVDGEIVADGGVAAGYVVRCDTGYTFYHAGDTALFSDMQLIGDLWRPELAFLPIGDRFTMDPRQAARACRYLGVRKVVPIHWGTFPPLTGTPEQLEQALADLGVNCEVIRLDAGETY